MKTFEIMEHTADIGIVAYGADLKQTFSHAAEGLFSLIVDLDTVRERSIRQVVASASDMEMLLASWLNELIYIFDTEYLIFKRFEITEITGEQLTANCYGEQVNHRRSVDAAIRQNRLVLVDEIGKWIGRVRRKARLIPTRKRLHERL
jgi:SHS2 domain-containing protein